MNPNINHQLEVRYQADGPEGASFEHQLRKIQQFLKKVSTLDPTLKDSEWLIATGERDSSYLYPVFDETGPTSASLAVLRERSKANEVVKAFGLWNGQEDRTKSASITCYFGRQDGVANSFKLSIRSPRGQMRLGTWERVAETLATAAEIFAPIYGCIETMYYDAVFNDRPGAGWMLYLPRILTVQEVPEARALVPVMGYDAKGKAKQVGTIIVSVTDEPFAEDNPDHVSVAHAIEIRLVDQDLLPRFIDL